jgi:hypothetical protein
MTQNQLLAEVMHRLHKRFPMQFEPLPASTIRGATDEICGELGLAAGDVQVETRATQPGRIDYFVAVDALERISAIRLPMAIEAEEVKTAILAAVENGEIGTANDADWRQVYEPTIRFGNWSIDLFIEANAVYHVQYACAPDGREQAFRNYHQDPWQLLTEEQQATVERALGRPE